MIINIILVLHKNHTDSTNDTLNFKKYSHPRTNLALVYCLNNKGEIHELQSSQIRRHGSWMLDNYMIGNSSISIATKIDPRFLLLPFLLKSTKYSPLDQIVTHIDGCDRLPLEYSNTWNLDEICDINDSFGDDMLLYRLN